MHVFTPALENEHTRIFFGDCRLLMTVSKQTGPKPYLYRNINIFVLKYFSLPYLGRPRKTDLITISYLLFSALSSAATIHTLEEPDDIMKKFI